MKRTLLIKSHSKLFLRDKQLIVKKENMKEECYELSYPVEDVETVVLESQQISITSALLNYLAESNVLVITCDSRTMPTGLLLPIVGNSLQAERYSHQLLASLPLKKKMWQHTIQCKIHNQACSMKRNSVSNANCLLKWEKNVKSNDNTKMEARAAQYYWSHLFDNINDFKRHRYGLPPNNLLNYGYAILRIAMIRNLVKSGLLVTLGIHHHNKYNPYCLADDIMEPYRPFIDNKVCQIIEIYSDISSLDIEHKNLLFETLKEEVVIDGIHTTLDNAISITANSVQTSFREKKMLLTYPQFKKQS